MENRSFSLLCSLVSQSAKFSTRRLHGDISGDICFGSRHRKEKAVALPLDCCTRLGVLYLQLVVTNPQIHPSCCRPHSTGDLVRVSKRHIFGCVASAATGRTYACCSGVQNKLFGPKTKWTENFDFLSCSKTKSQQHQKNSNKNKNPNWFGFVSVATVLQKQTTFFVVFSKYKNAY